MAGYCANFLLLMIILDLSPKRFQGCSHMNVEKCVCVCVGGGGGVKQIFNDAG